MTPKDKVAPRIIGTSFDGTGFVLALASMADSDAVLAFRLRNRQFFWLCQSLSTNRRAMAGPCNDGIDE